MQSNISILRKSAASREDRWMTTPLTLALLALALLPSGGCETTESIKPPEMGQFVYRVSLDPRLKTDGMMPSIEVDFVAVTRSQRELWAGVEVDEYFRPSHSLRTHADKFTMAFTNDHPDPQTLSSAAPIWNTKSWSAAEYMFVIESRWIDDLGELTSDPRRIELPLDMSRWPEGSIIDIVIRPSGVEVLTPMVDAQP